MVDKIPFMIFQGWTKPPSWFLQGLDKLTFMIVQGWTKPLHDLSRVDKTSFRKKSLIHVFIYLCIILQRYKKISTNTIIASLIIWHCCFMFNLFTDREQVRRRKFKLENSKQEQFPPEVVARRRRLVPKLRDAKKKRQNVLDIIRYLVYRRHTCQYGLRRRGGRC